MSNFAFLFVALLLARDANASPVVMNETRKDLEVRTTNPACSFLDYSSYSVFTFVSPGSPQALAADACTYGCTVSVAVGTTDNSIISVYTMDSVNTDLYYLGSNSYAPVASLSASFTTCFQATYTITRSGPFYVLLECSIADGGSCIVESQVTFTEYLGGYGEDIYCSGAYDCTSCLSFGGCAWCTSTGFNMFGFSFTVPQCTGSYNGVPEYTYCSGAYLQTCPTTSSSTRPTTTTRTSTSSKSQTLTTTTTATAPFSTTTATSVHVTSTTTSQTAGMNITSTSAQTNTTVITPTTTSASATPAQSPPSSAAASGSTASAGSPIGAIIGALIGGMVIGGLAVAAFFQIRLRLKLDKVVPFKDVNNLPPPPRVPENEAVPLSHVPYNDGISPFHPTPMHPVQQQQYPQLQPQPGPAQYQLPIQQQQQPFQQQQQQQFIDSTAGQHQQPLQQ